MRGLDYFQNKLKFHFMRIEIQMVSFIRIRKYIKHLLEKNKINFIIKMNTIPNNSFSKI